MKRLVLSQFSQISHAIAMTLTMTTEKTARLFPMITRLETVVIALILIILLLIALPKPSGVPHRLGHRIA